MAVVGGGLNLHRQWVREGDSGEKNGRKRKKERKKKKREKILETRAQVLQPEYIPFSIFQNEMLSLRILNRIFNI